MQPHCRGKNIYQVDYPVEFTYLPIQAKYEVWLLFTGRLNLLLPLLHAKKTPIFAHEYMAYCHHWGGRLWNISLQNLQSSFHQPCPTSHQTPWQLQPSPHPCPVARCLISFLESLRRLRRTHGDCVHCTPLGPHAACPGQPRCCPHHDQSFGQHHLPAPSTVLVSAVAAFAEGTVLLAASPHKRQETEENKTFLATSQLSPSRVQGLNFWVIRNQRHHLRREEGTLSAEGIFHVGWWWGNY